MVVDSRDCSELSSILPNTPARIPLSDVTLSERPKDKTCNLLESVQSIKGSQELATLVTPVKGQEKISTATPRIAVYESPRQSDPRDSGLREEAIDEINELNSSDNIKFTRTPGHSDEASFVAEEDVCDVSGSVETQGSKPISEVTTLDVPLAVLPMSPITEDQRINHHHRSSPLVPPTRSRVSADKFEHKPLSPGNDIANIVILPAAVNLKQIECAGAPQQSVSPRKSPIKSSSPSSDISTHTARSPCSDITLNKQCSRPAEAFLPHQNLGCTTPRTRSTLIPIPQTPTTTWIDGIEVPLPPDEWSPLKLSPVRKTMMPRSHSPIRNEISEVQHRQPNARELPSIEEADLTTTSVLGFSVDVRDDDIILGLDESPVHNDCSSAVCTISSIENRPKPDSEAVLDMQQVDGSADVESAMSDSHPASEILNSVQMSNTLAEGTAIPSDLPSKIMHTELTTQPQPNNPSDEVSIEDQLRSPEPLLICTVPAQREENSVSSNESEVAEHFTELDSCELPTMSRRESLQADGQCRAVPGDCIMHTAGKVEQVIISAEEGVISLIELVSEVAHIEALTCDTEKVLQNTVTTDGALQVEAVICAEESADLSSIQAEQLDHIDEMEQMKNRSRSDMLSEGGENSVGGESHVGQNSNEPCVQDQLQLTEDDAAVLKGPSEVQDEDGCCALPDTSSELFPAAMTVDTSCSYAGNLSPATVADTHIGLNDAENHQIPVNGELPSECNEWSVLSIESTRGVAEPQPLHPVENEGLESQDCVASTKELTSNSKPKRNSSRRQSRRQSYMTATKSAVRERELELQHRQEQQEEECIRLQAEIEESDFLLQEMPGSVERKRTKRRSNSASRKSLLVPPNAIVSTEVRRTRSRTSNESNSSSPSARPGEINVETIVMPSTEKSAIKIQALFRGWRQRRAMTTESTVSTDAKVSEDVACATENQVREPSPRSDQSQEVVTSEEHDNNDIFSEFLSKWQSKKSLKAKLGEEVALESPAPKTIISTPKRVPVGILSPQKGDRKPIALVAMLPSSAQKSVVRPTLGARASTTNLSVVRPGLPKRNISAPDTKKVTSRVLETKRGIPVPTKALPSLLPSPSKRIATSRFENDKKRKDRESVATTNVPKRTKLQRPAISCPPSASSVQTPTNSIIPQPIGRTKPVTNPARPPTPVTPKKLLHLTPAEVAKTTRQFTSHNRLYRCDFDRVVIKKELPRPPSPTAKIQAKMASNARTKRRRLMKEKGYTFGAGDADDYVPKFVTPERRAVKWGEELEVDLQNLPKHSPTKAKSINEVVPCLVPAMLDDFGNVEDSAPLTPILGKPSKVIITKYLYRGEQDD